MEKIKRAKCISMVLLIMMVLQLLMPVSFAYGDTNEEHGIDLSEGGSSLLSGSTTSSAITATINLVFKDKKGDIIDHTNSSVSIPLDASVNLSVRLDIKDMDTPNDPDDEGFIDISEDYVIKIAEQISISEDKEIAIYHPTDKDVQIATARINTDGSVKITFLPAINEYDEGRYVKIEADGTMDASELGEGGEQVLEFEFPGKTETVNVKFDEKVETVTVDKSGSWDKDKNEISWTITVKASTTPKGLDIKNVVITDTIGSGQTWDRVVDNGGSKYDDVSKTFTFEQLNDGATKTIKVVTRPDLSAFEPKDEDKTITLKNTSGGTYGKEGVITDKTAEVKNTVDFINKKGQFISGATRDKDVIKWTIEINNNNLTIPAGTTLEDIIPKNLKLNSDSVKIDGKAVSEFSGASFAETENGFKITFGNGLTKKATITYETSIDDTDAYEPDKTVRYVNNAKLTWTDNGEKSVTGTGEVGIGRTVIQKSVNGYEANDNRYVKWKITINKDKLDIKNPVVTDTLPKELEYVSHTISPTTEVWTTTTTGTAIGGGQVITFSYSGDIIKTYTITLITKIKDEYKDIYGANKDTPFTNEVSLSGTNVTKTNKATATETYKSTVIAKSNTGYDYTARRASWEIIVNQNKMTINNAVVTDTIGDYHEFVDGSLKLGDTFLERVEGGPGVGQYSVVNKVVTINLGKIDKTTEKITYETEIPETVLVDIFGKNSTTDTPKITNSATITGDEIKAGGQNVKSEKLISNTVISKKAKYNTGDDFIEWLVEVNLSQLDFGDANITLEDTLQSILILDKNSVKLYELNMKPDGTYEPINESNIVVGKVTVDYDTTTNKVVFELGKINKAYLLKFTTDINSDKLNQTISNTISLKGHAKISDNATGSKQVNFNNLGGEGNGSKTKGSIKIIKNDDYENPIEGVKFELYDQLKKPFDPAKISITNEEGIAYFEDLPIGTYWIKEVSVPVGFVMLQDEIDVTIKKGVPTPELDPKNPVKTILNDRIVKDKIVVKKVDEAGKVLTGVKFDLYEKGGNKIIKSAVSDANGFVTFDDIIKGEYEIKEAEAPEGYLKSKTVIYVKAEKIPDDISRLNIIYSYDGNDYTVENPEFINTSIDIELIKKNDRDILLPGAQFTLYDSKGEQVGEAVVSKAVIGENLNGNVIFKGIKPGTYTIKETGFPESYIKTPVEIEVTVSVSKDGTEKTVTFDGYEDNEIPTIENKLDIKDDIIIIKADTLDNPLKLAEFDLYTLVNGELAEKVASAQSKEDGTVRFEMIPEGTYVVKEKTPPAGYLKSDNLIYVKVDRTKDSKPKVEYSIDKENYTSVVPKFINNSINIEFSKKDKNNNPLEGAVFEIYHDDGTPVLDADNKNVASTSGDDGKVVFKAIPAGIYTIKETKAPSGYKDYSKEIKAVVTADGQVNLTVDEEVLADNTVINEKRSGGGGTLVFGKIAIKKTDEDKKVLSGAEFTLYDEDGKVVDKAVTGSDGTVSFEDLETGNYVLKETKAPEGYVLDENETDITISGSQTKTYTFTNKKEEPKKPGRIEIIKTDEKGKLLSDAWFSLIDEKGSTLQNVETVNGRAVFENVPAGKYTVKEVQAPEGYEPSSQAVSVTVGSEETVTVRFINKLSGTTTVVPVYGNILINKVDENSMALPGAEFTLYNENNEIIGTAVSDESGKVMFENLVEGKYFVKETKAPEGYELVSDALNVNVAAGKTYSYKFKNIPSSALIGDPDVPVGWETIEDPDVPGDTTLPDTGSLLNTWILTVIGLIFMLTGIVLYGKRRIIG